MPARGRSESLRSIVDGSPYHYRRKLLMTADAQVHPTLSPPGARTTKTLSWLRRSRVRWEAENREPQAITVFWAPDTPALSPTSEMKPRSSATHGALTRRGNSCQWTTIAAHRLPREMLVQITSEKFASASIESTYRKGHFHTYSSSRLELSRTPFDELRSNKPTVRPSGEPWGTNAVPLYDSFRQEGRFVAWFFWQEAHLRTNLTRQTRLLSTC